MKIPQGFLAETYEMLSERYPRLNKDYLFSIAEILLSSASWNVYTIDDYGALAPNVWVQMIAPSGDGKSLVIDYFLIPVLDELEKLLETEKTVTMLYLSDYTSEGIMKLFNNKDKTAVWEDGKKKTKRIVATFGLLCKDEKTMYIKAAMQKNYMAGIVEVESKIFDGTLYRKATTSRGLEEVPKCFKANISATTPAIYELMKTDAFIQGGWNRYDMIVGNPLKPEEVEMLDEDFFIGSRKKLDEFEAIPKAYADKLSVLAKGDKIFIAMDEKASLLWRQFEKELKQNALKICETDLRRGYLQRQAEKALKRAMLYTISMHLSNLHMLKPDTFTDFNGKTRTEKMLICEGHIMEMAIANQEEFYINWLRMLEERGRTAPKSEVRTNEAERNWFKICCLSLKKKHGLFSRKLLIEKTQWNDGDRRLVDNIDSAKVEGKLKVIYGDDSRVICMKHRNVNDMEWFKEQKISPSFKNPPNLYEWIAEQD